MSNFIKTNHFLITLSCSLSSLAFIPVSNSYKNDSLDPANNYLLVITFACVLSSSFPLILEYVLDLSRSFKNLRPSVDHLYLVERWALISGYVYPTICYFILISFARNSVGEYYFYLVNSQTIWQAGSILTILHSSCGEIWSFKWTLWILLCATVNTISGAFGTTSTNALVISISSGFGTVVSFLYVYRLMVLSIWNKKWSHLSMGEYVCMAYSTLIFFMFFIQCIVPSIVDQLYGDAACIVYVNIALVVCINISSNIQSRAIQYRRLESTEQSLATKQAFIRYLSHEMRTPMNVALVGLDLHERYLKDQNMYNNECKDVLTDVKDSVGVALGTLNEVLNYEKLQASAMALEKTKENPLTFVLSSFGIFRTPAVNAGINLVLPTVAATPYLDCPCVEIDIYKMSQVMRNLISNAIKFTPRGGTITITLGIREVEQSPRQRRFYFPFLYYRATQVVVEEWLEICVQDTGIGIAPENLGRVFTEIVQFDPNHNQGGNGSGLGLFISRGIVELHGGRVVAHSDGLNQGCSFSVLLPFLKETVDQNRVVYDLEMQYPENQPVVLRFDTKPGELSVHTSFERPPISTERASDKSKSQNRLHGVKILAVDDSAMNLKMCCKLFRNLGAEVEQAEDGCIAVDMVEALLLLQQQQQQQASDIEAGSDVVVRMYDAIVMDNFMPVMCGPAACQAIRQLGFKGLVVGLTGHALPEDIADYIAHGANSVLKKPINMAEFFEALQDCIE